MAEVRKVPGSVHLTAYYKGNWTQNIVLTNSNGSPYSIAGSTAQFVVYEMNGTAALTTTPTHTGAGGVITIAATNAQIVALSTQDYRYELILTLADTTVLPILDDIFSITEDGATSSSATDISITIGGGDITLTLPIGVQGPQGFQGDLGGPQGPQGAQGADGFVGSDGAQGPQGAAGTGITLKGSVATVGDLPASGNTPGDLYIVQADGDGYAWDGADWNNVGPIQGPQGAQGATGPQGTQGAIGAQGNQGTTGAQGNQGAAGAQGTQGFQGNQGTQGFQGVVGATGPQGAQGSTGTTGAQGDQGATGATGSQGATGTQGAQGNQGNQGVTGAAGPQGNQGDTGNTGPQGDTGDTGPQGAQGFQGNQGAQGNTGAQGNQGNQGTQGFQGVAGTGITLLGTVDEIGDLPASGNNIGDLWIVAADGHGYAWDGADWNDVGLIQGPQGDQGATGATGPQGFQGNQGAQGFQGNQGFQGVAGSTGAQGNQGVTGATGAQGDQGDDGAAGPQGDDGATGPQGSQGATGSTGAQGAQGAQGNTGATGAQGNQGAQGDQGDSGNTAGLRYNFDTSTTDADPGAGLFRFNNGTVGDITEVYLDALDQGANDQLNYIDTWADSSSTVKGHLLVDSADSADPTFLVFEITGVTTASGYRKVAVSYLSGSLPANAEACAITFSRSGNTGSQGNQGSDGATGPQGSTGAQGATGAQGSQGNQGFQGVSGSTGAQGNQGNQGFQGTTGSQGNQGFQGVAGAQGVTGAEGPQGDDGATGPQGNQGFQGVAGGSTTWLDEWDNGTAYNVNDAVSIDGSSYICILGHTNQEPPNPTYWNLLAQAGAQGPQGAQGATGTTGAQGPQGDDGATGPQGDQGDDGAAGPQGFQGNQGFQGVVGATGSQGTQGFQGNQGFQGTTGAAGSQGNQGFQGTQGFQGNQGAKGDSGGLRYNFSTTTTDSDPGTGNFRFNSGTIGSVTQIFIDLLDAGSVTQTAFLDALDDSTNTVKGHLYINSNDPADATFLVFQVNSITSATGYRKIGVTYLTGALPSNTEACALVFSRAGDVGAQGAQGNQGFQGVVGAQGTQGFQGNQGTTGSTGSTGAQGNQGFQGTQGVTGSTGAQGNQGNQGFQGTQGNQGFQGTQGNQGDEGGFDDAQTINAQTGTTYTLVLTDAGKLVTLSNASAITVTIPTDASVAFTVGTHIDLAQIAAGQATISPTGGVTMNSRNGTKLAGQYAVSTLIKTATNTWLLAGDVTT